MSWSILSVLGSGGLFNISDTVSGVVYGSNSSSYPRLRKSVDSGVTWSDLGFSGVGVTGLAISKVSGKVFAAGNPNSYIYMSTDAGLNWNQVAGTGPYHWYDLSADDFGNLYGAVYGGNLYKSVDDGATWSQIGVSGTWVSIAKVGNTIFAIQYGRAVYQSTDEGATWEPAAWPVRSWLRVRGSVYRMYAVEAYGNTYTSTDGGATWSDTAAPDTGFKAISMLPSGGALFGKPASLPVYSYAPPPPPPPTIYPPSGNYRGIQFAGIVASQGFIRYTTDGSTPTATSEIFTHGFRITDGMTVKAVADLDGILSTVSSATYSIQGDKLQPIPSYTAHVLPYLLEQYKGDNP